MPSKTNFPTASFKSPEKLTLASLPKQERRRSQKTNVEESVFQSQSGGARRRLVRARPQSHAIRFLIFSSFFRFMSF
jgi:hypothetical protein